MPRTTDSPWDTKPSNPLGERVTPPTQKPPAQPMKPVGPSGIVTDENGRMRTIHHPRPW